MFTFRVEGLDKLLKRLDGFERQIPFVLATTLNNAADSARDQLPRVWAEHITVRNPNFLRAALTTRGRRATKASLRVELYDQYGRGNLGLHSTGGAAHGSGALAIPTTSSGIKGRRGAKGVPKGLQPRNLARSFGKVGKSGDVLIYQQVGKYQKATKAAHKRAAKSGGPRPKGKDNRHLRLEYVTKQTNRVRADVPFQAEFVRIMRREVPKQFSVAVKAAMKTAFRK